MMNIRSYPLPRTLTQTVYTGLYTKQGTIHGEDHRRRRTEASTQTHTHTHTDPDTHTLTDTHLTVSTVNPHYHEVMYISVTRKEMF